MQNQNRFRAGKSTSRTGRVSIEAIVSLSIAALSLLIFGLMGMANSDRSKPKSSTETGAYSPRPHEAIAFGGQTADTSADGTTMTRDGITIMTPRLAVPVVNLDEHGQPLASPASAEADDADADTDDGTSPSVRHHRHRTLRAPARTTAERRIVGLAADRHVVTAR